MLEEFTQRSGAVPSEIGQYIASWLEGGLKDWDVSRDGPYLDLKSRARMTNTFMSGWMRRLDTLA